MADLDELFAEIPTQQIASRLGADEAEVNQAVKSLLPALVGGLQHNAQDPGTAAGIASAANQHAVSGLLDGGVDVDQVDVADGSRAVAKIFGGNDTGQVASALSGGGAGNSELINKLLPILAPIVLAYIGRKLSGGQTAPGQSGDNPLGDILGGVLGGGKAGGLGDILGGLLGGRK